MRWLFLSPSLDFQKDGIADYCARLLEALQKQGAEGRVYGYKNQPQFGVFARMLQDYSPDVISWQFAPYGYQPKGIPLSMRKWAKFMRNHSAHRHLMMHELWLGLNKNCSAKERWIGGVQSLVIRNVLKTYQPQVIHTSNNVYQKALALNGFEANISPVFGNISRIDPTDMISPWPAEMIPDKFFRVVHFGRVHPPMDIDSVVDQLSAGATLQGKSLALAFAGHTHRSPGWLDPFKKKFPAVAIFETGELSASVLSTLLLQADAGLSSTPLALIGKSGSFSAMREHGLPVLIARNDFSSRYYTPSEPLQSGCYPLSEMAKEGWTEIQRTEVYSGVDTVAKQLLQAFRR